MKSTCPKCGTIVDSASTFCGQCGTPLKTTAQSVPPPIPSGPPALPQNPPPISQHSFTPGQTAITIQRPKQFTGSARSYKIFLDNVEITTIKNGESKTIPINPGNHSIYAKMDPNVSLTIPFSIAESTNRLFSVHPSPPLPTSTILLKGAVVATLTAKPGEVVTLELLN